MHGIGTNQVNISIGHIDIIEHHGLWLARAGGKSSVHACSLCLICYQQRLTHSREWLITYIRAKVSACGTFFVYLIKEIQQGVH